MDTVWYAAYGSNLEDDGLAGYLLDCPGVAPTWARDDLLELLAA